MRRNSRFALARFAALFAVAASAELDIIPGWLRGILAVCAAIGFGLLVLADCSL